MSTAERYVTASLVEHYGSQTHYHAILLAALESTPRPELSEEARAGWSAGVSATRSKLLLPRGPGESSDAMAAVPVGTLLRPADARDLFGVLEAVAHMLWLAVEGRPKTAESCVREARGLVDLGKEIVKGMGARSARGPA